MSEAVWNKAFTQGSRSLQDRLKKVHASNPKFQAWLKSSGHGTDTSVKQASKEVKPSARVKSLQTKSLQAYGATKGAKVGGEHGSGEMKDTIAPLTRDQHSKVQAAERAAKAAAKVAAPAKPKKPLSQAERMAVIRKAATKAKSKERFDVPTVNPDDVDHDDLRDVHQSLHVSRSYNEEVESVEEGVATAQKVMDRANVVAKTNPDPKKRFAASGLAQKAMLRTINPTGVNTGITRGGGNKTYRMVTGKAPPYQLTKKTGVSEEVELDEVTKQEAEKMLGGPVKTRTGSEPKGKLPLGFRRARNLARKAMKTVKESTTEVLEVNEMNHGKKLAKMIMAKQSQHPIAQHMGEAIKDAADVGEYDYEGDMAKSQLRSILTNAKRLHDMLEDTTNLPEWVQSKITLAEDYILTAANYMEGEMNEETLAALEAELVEEIELFEKAPPGSKYERMVKHIKKGYAKDGLTPQEKSIAYATAWKAYNKAKNEEVETEETAEQIEEKYMGFAAVKKAVAAKGARNPAAVAAYIGRKKYGKEKFQAAAAAGKKLGEEVEQIDEQSPAEIKAKYYHDQFDKVKPVKAYDKEGKLVGRYRSMDHAKQMKPGHTYKVEEEVVTEAEGKVAVTPKEKDLAAHHGDKTRITYGDVIKARLKSAAAKKMGKQ